MSELPETIAECFTVWCGQLLTDDDLTDEGCAAKCHARARIERHAVRLPAVTARDVWQLVAMTTDAPPEGFEVVSHNAMVVRAYRETGTYISG